MLVAEFARDPGLAPRSLTQEKLRARQAFVTVRVRALLAQAGSTNLDEVPDAQIGRLRTQLQPEIQNTVTAHSTVAARLAADTALYDLTKVDPRLRHRYLGLVGLLPATLTATRASIIREAVWLACAQDPSLQNAARVDDLHLLIDRRLRITERMLYDVGKVSPDRVFRWKEIRSNPSGPWKDSWTRIFEYPRVPRAKPDVFLKLCQPNSTNRTCQGVGMAGWQDNGTDIVHNFQVNLLGSPGASTSTSWVHLPGVGNGSYTFSFDKSTGRDPAKAIDDLFQASDDFRKRNLLNCDQVIQALHLESLLFAKRKRNPDTSWLTNLVSSKDPGWLRIDNRWRRQEDSRSAVFLGNQNEPQFFETKSVHISEVQVGDHVIVFNHPAYYRASPRSVMRLENALVVRVVPLVLQGHGTDPKTLEGMKSSMVSLFNAALKRLQGLVQGRQGDAPIPVGSESGGTGMLVRRFDAASSAFAPQQRDADWWLQWPLPTDAGKDDFLELPVVSTAQWRDTVKAIQRIEYDPIARVGWFPLFEARSTSDRRRIQDASGLINKINPVKVNVDMIRGLKWFVDDPSTLAKDYLWLVRPKL